MLVNNFGYICGNYQEWVRQPSSRNHNQGVSKTKKKKKKTRRGGQDARRFVGAEMLTVWGNRVKWRRKVRGEGNDEEADWRINWALFRGPKYLGSYGSWE